MRIAIFGEGTRGDISPLVALGARMTRLGHEISMTASGEFRPMVEAAGIRFVALPASVTAYLASEEGQRSLRRGGLPQVLALQRFRHRHSEQIDDAFVEAGEGADALLSFQLTQDRAQCLSEALRVPHAIVHFAPLAPTGDFSSLLLTTRRLPTAALRRGTHHLAYRTWWFANRSDNRAFANRLGLPRPPRPSLYLHDHPGALLLNAFSPSLVSRPPEWGAHRPITGFWQLPSTVRSTIDESLPEDLATWIDAGEPPVFLGFGSMPVLDPERLMNTVIEVTRSLGVRAIVNMPLAGGSEWPADELPDELRWVGAVDHDRLFPGCVAAIHHGGAGTIAASLRAGLPTMVCSVWADQPFWGARLEQLGCGVHVPFRGLDRSKLEAGVRQLLSDPLRRRAASLGEAIRAEGDGTARAAQLLDGWLPTAEPI
ncbi:MAG TPA: glycosyltransferase [Solirubrobacterales bacterium]|nr:glycosyltransferase [Solirubrobacterales bacterium]